MRYYEVHIPGREQPIITTNVRRYRNLPDGTQVERIITDRDGSLIESEPIEVLNGRAAIAGNGKHRPQIWYG